MAVRTPLYNNAGNLQQMTSTMIDNIIDQVIYQYSQTPGVALSVVSSGGSLASITDTRLRSGTAATSVSSFPGEGSTGEPQTVTTTFDKINQSSTSTSLTTDGGTLYPCYLDGSNNIQAMTLADMKDTFIHPAVDLLTAATTTSQQAGTYFISTSTSVSGSTLISATPVFSDTRANTASFSAGNIGTSGTTQDFPTTINNFYLHRINGTDNSYTLPMYIRSADSDLQVYPEADFETMIKNLIDFTAESSTDGYSISYNVGTSGSGNTRGSGMTNTILNGSGNYQQRFVNADDYRAQEFPNGTAVTSATYYLRINKS